MAKRAKSQVESKSDSAAGPKQPGGAMRVLTLLLAAYAAVMATLAYSKGGASSGGSKDGAHDGLEARFAAEASRIRSEVQGDFNASLAKAKDQCAAEGKKAAVEAASARTMKEALEGQSEAAAKSYATRSENLESKVDDAVKDSQALKDTVATLSVAVDDLRSRPAAAGPVPGARDPIPVKPAPPVPVAGAEPAPVPAGPTPEEIAKNKAKVRDLIGDLSSADIGKVFNACALLGKLGDLEAVPPLMKVAKEHKDALVRSAALSALGKLHACDAVPTILAAMTEKDPSVVLMAGQAFTQISGLDSLLTGDATKKERNDAKERWTKWWKDHEGEMREKWKQPVDGAPPPAAPAPSGDGGMGDAGMGEAGMADGAK